MKMLTAGIFAAVAAVGFAEAEVRLVDGDFESSSVVRNWGLPKAWSVVSGAGRGGSRAVVWDNADPNHYAFPYRQFVAEPGARFRFGGWIKAERGGLDDLNPQISIDWSDAQGKWMGAAVTHRVVDNDPNTCGWSRYEGVVTIPSGAATAKFLFYLPHGKTGRVLFDDLSLEQIPDEPLVYLQCGAYRNAFTSEDGDIRFAVMMRLNTVRNRLADYSCEVVFREASGATAVRPVTGFDAAHALFAVPASDFALGRQEVAFRLRLKGKVVAEKMRAVTRTAEPVCRRVSIDKSRRVVIDGRRFFPLGMYTNSGMKPEDFELWAQAPLNFTTMYGKVNRETLDRFAKTGTYVCADVRGLIYGYNYSAVSPFKNFDESRAAFAKTVAELGAHPNFFGWYLVDEVPIDQAPFVTAANELLQELDPDHPTYAVTDKPHHVRELLPTYDAVGMDPYPIGGWKRDLTIASGWAWECREAMFDFRPMWHVPQLFNWRWYSEKGVPDYKSTANLPTRREMANMAWQGIAAGANGICGYSFGSMRRNGSKAEQAKFWPDVCRVLREIKSMESVLLGDDIELPVANLPKTLAARAYRLDGVDYLLIVNRTFENVVASLDLPKDAYASLTTRCGEGAYLDGNSLKVIFDGLGYAFLRLDRTAPRRFVAADESQGCLRYIDESDASLSFAVPVSKPVWNLTRIAPGEYRVVGGSGYEVVRLSERRVVRRFRHPALKGITAMADWPDGGFVACVEAGHAVRFPRFDASGKHVATYVCETICDPSNMRRTGRDELAVAWERGFVRLRVPAEVAPGTDPASPIPLVPFADVRQPGGRNGFDAVPSRDGKGWWLTTGYSTRLCRFDNTGRLVSTWQADMGTGLKSTFYAQIHEASDGLVYLAQWNGHSPTAGAKGWQALAFDAQGRVVWHFHDPRMGSFDGFDLLP